MNIFYDNFTNIYELHTDLDTLAVPSSARRELMDLVDSTVHHEVFDLIMLELNPKNHETFLNMFSTDPSDPEIMSWLRVRIPDVEEKIRARGTSVKEDFRKKIRKHHESD